MGKQRKSSVNLIVWLVNDKGRRKLTVRENVDGTPMSEGDARRMAHSLYKGMRTKVVSATGRPETTFSANLRSASDKLYCNKTRDTEEYGYVF